MAWFATTRAGVASFLDQSDQQNSLWMGANVLSNEEIDLLRERGYSVTTFTNKIATWTQIQDEVCTIQEHHPNEVIWIQPLPKEPNPRSEDIGQAFLWHEPIVDAKYDHNASVKVTSGLHIGLSGSLVSITGLRPSVTYMVELESGLDAEIEQSFLRQVDL